MHLAQPADPPGAPTPPAPPAAPAWVTGENWVRPRPLFTGHGTYDGWSVFSPGGLASPPDARPDLFFADGDAPVTQHRAAELFGLYHVGRRDTKYQRHTGWHLWDGLRWRPDDGAATVLHEVRQFVTSTTATGVAAGARRSAESATFIAGVERMLRADPEYHVDADYFDTNPDLLGIPGGGAIDLRTGDRLPPDKAHRLTRMAGTYPDDEYGLDPADGGPGGPPRWLRFLTEATGDDADLIGYLQRWAGYCLTGHTREHALLFVHGPGGTGKTTFANVLAYVLGGYATTAPMSTFASGRYDEHPTDLAGLAGARLVTATETDEGRPWAEAKLKLVTGGDPITARFMRRDFFTYLPAFKVCVVGNALPRLTNADSAMRRRFNRVPFDHPPAAPDRRLEAALRDEAPYILEWAISGAIAWYRRGLGDCPTVELATTEYFNEADHVAQWLEERTNRVDPTTGISVKSGALYADFKRWAEGRGHDPRNATLLGRELSIRGYLKCHRRDGNYWSGLQLADETTDRPPYRE